ncbi:MAG TPA: hypothetical protein VGR73_02585 [Bryobacteraceae bacterium]|nr:hypothetical protein [Bryobacteraceae bacterium]
MKIFTTTFMLASLMTPLTAQWAQYPTPAIPRTANGKANLAAPAPRTAAGKPDLSGLWEVVTDVEGRTTADIKPADVQPWAQALIQQRTENFGRDNPHYKCLPQGPIYSTAGGFKRFIQTPAMMVILNDDLTYRQIFTDGRALEGDPNPSWMGYSVGHWEGETLVVESNGFNNRTWLMGYRPHTESLRITERFRRPDFGHLDVAVTFQDPEAFNRAWTVPVHSRFAADTELIEAVCNEFPNNEQEHWIGKTSDAETKAVKVAPEVLAKYVGVYKGIYLRNAEVVEVTLSDGKLFVALNGGEKRVVFPQSETNFAGTGFGYQFILDDRGIASHVVESRVSGDYKYERQK